MTDLERAKEALTTIDCTCALCRDEEVRTTQLRGVAPLLSWLEEGLSGWSVADRVVEPHGSIPCCTRRWSMPR